MGENVVWVKSSSEIVVSPTFGHGQYADFVTSDDIVFVITDWSQTLKDVEALIGD